MTFSTEGYELLNAFIPPPLLTDICDELDGVILDDAQGGIRNAEKRFQTIKHLAQSIYCANHVSVGIKRLPNQASAEPNIYPINHLPELSTHLHHGIQFDDIPIEQKFSAVEMTLKLFG